MDHGQFLRPPGETVRLSAIDPGSLGEFGSEEEAQASAERDARSLLGLQDMLMAHERHGLLILFQGMDASGKDEAIRDVLSSLDPRGSEFKQFKPMTEKEVRHDYLWRAVASLPARGQIGIFNRSYYEHVVVERLHPEQLDRQRLPAASGEGIWQQRFRQIDDFERYLAENGIHLLKFFLHLSKAEQRKRLLERIERPETSWRFSRDDVEERGRWGEYMSAYEEALTHTNSEHAPWYVVPADKRWVTQAVVASVIAAELRSLHSEYPELTEEQREEIEWAREILEGESPGD
ncbi:MAG: polyphosphate kinase 2 family protein [Gemmatimonadetes bacterium]|nr:polyphosphate kinase 2 family protein [Gemmatimonadota bacterium]